MKKKYRRPGPLMWFVKYLINNRGDETEGWLVSSYFRWYPYDQYGAL